MIGLYARLANTVRDRGLRCVKCGAIQLPTEDELAGYFATGWPKHCGETMHMEQAVWP